VQPHPPIPIVARASHPMQSYAPEAWIISEDTYIHLRIMAAGHKAAAARPRLEGHE
jgi:hypothetical protein